MLWIWLNYFLVRILNKIFAGNFFHLFYFLENSISHHLFSLYRGTFTWTLNNQFCCMCYSSACCSSVASSLPSSRSNIATKKPSVRSISGRAYKHFLPTCLYFLLPKFTQYSANRIGLTNFQPLTLLMASRTTCFRFKKEKFDNVKL